MHTTQENVTNGLVGPVHAFTNQQSHGRNSNLIQLIISNLEPSVSPSEWRRILIIHVQSVIQNTFQLQVIRQPESGCFAIVKVSTMEDAQMAISQLNRRKIGYRRIRVGFLNPKGQNERHSQKYFAPNQSTQQRYQYNTKMYMMKSQSDTSQSSEKKDDKTGYMVPSQVHTGTLPKLEDPLCPKHQPRDPRECIQMASQQRMPAVMIGLAELRPNVVQLLQEHNKYLSVISFTRCYEETFGPLNKAESVSEQTHDNDKKSNKDSVFMSNYVSLEHLITCVPDVSIQLTANGIRVVTLSQDISQEVTAVSATTDMASEGLTATESLRHFRREVVDLVKQQVGCALPLNKFIPAYHAHFGKQCRVSDYGFARLQDLIEALRGIVHIVGEGPLRTIMLTHVIQVRRFTHDLLRLLKGEQKKCIPITKLPQIYEAVFHKVS